MKHLHTDVSRTPRLRLPILRVSCNKIFIVPSIAHWDGKYGERQSWRLFTTVGDDGRWQMLEETYFRLLGCRTLFSFRCELWWNLNVLRTDARRVEDFVQLDTSLGIYCFLRFHQTTINQKLNLTRHDHCQRRTRDVQRSLWVEVV